MSTEMIVALYKAALCRMHEGHLVPFDNATIEDDSISGAIIQSKFWAGSVDGWKDAWLQITLDGKGVASFAPGTFEPVPKARSGPP